MRHSLLFLSLGANEEQSTLLKNFGCSLKFDIELVNSFPKQQLSDEQYMHKVMLHGLKIPYYNRIFSDEKLEI
jgi:hypothetical protein